MALINLSTTDPHRRGRLKNFSLSPGSLKCREFSKNLLIVCSEPTSFRTALADGERSRRDRRGGFDSIVEELVVA